MQLFRGRRQLRERPLSPAALSQLRAVHRAGGGNDVREAGKSNREASGKTGRSNKFVVPCIFCTQATFLLHKYKLDKVRARRWLKRRQRVSGCGCGQRYVRVRECEPSPVPKLLASVAFNIPTTQSINIDTCRDARAAERQRNTHTERMKERYIERKGERVRERREGESVRTAYTLSHIPVYMAGDTCCN